MARITSEQVGRRVSVRRRTASGAATDVVGDLIEWTPETLTVRDRDDVEHQVPRRAVVAARIVRAAPVRPAVAELERVAARGWPATETALLGDWLLRAAGGFTGRANTVLAVGDPGMPLASATAAVRAWYAERGLPARAAVVLPSPEDDAFAAAGWPPSQAVLVQTAPLEPVAGAAPVDDRVQVSRSPSAGWLARYTARGQVDDVARRVLTGGGTVGFAQAGSEPAAIGRGVVVDDWLGIAAVEVAPDRRRQGLATAVTRALAHWGAEHGASRIYLQVQTDNTAARELYAALGFRTHHRYRYRTAPPA
ncbi:MAG: GNAT family N-acetyltransferase [Streptosporangiales bacterium]|nr:GNAT family N-acetyltransferase [Streptosporangiales bacterium]